MSVGTFLEIRDREYCVASSGWNVASRADSNLQAGLEVHNGKTAVTDRLKRGYSSLELCLA